MYLGLENHITTGTCIIAFCRGYFPYKHGYRRNNSKGHKTHLYIYFSSVISLIKSSYTKVKPHMYICTRACAHACTLKHIHNRYTKHNTLCDMKVKKKINTHA